MIESLTKYSRSSAAAYPLCVVIPSWNNLEMLKLCIRSIRENSTNVLQIIVVVNEGNDGTATWLESEGEIDYVHAKENIGICFALNVTRSLIKSDYLVYLNDDMYVLPHWDQVLLDEIAAIGHRNFMISATMIEPTETGNRCVVVRDYGREVATFREAELLRDAPSLIRADWNGSTWPPNVVPLDLWDLVGGLSIEYSPGMYSDPDFSYKLFLAGVRLFKGKGNSLVYHFGSKSTKRVKKNQGRKTFLLKWGISANVFTRQYLRVGDGFIAPVAQPVFSKIKKIVFKIKMVMAI